MDWASEFAWLLWGVPLSLAGLVALGWWLRGFEQRQWRTSRQGGPHAYVRGLSHLLNEQQDQAIDAFIEATRHDSESTELHFALGSLFRRRGDYDRAIRVHEHLLRRADVKVADQQRAQHELALDFLKAGLLDRAERTLAALLQTPRADDARLLLLSIYERARDWRQASQIAAELKDRGIADFSARLAHHACELAADALRHADPESAHAQLQAALRHAPTQVRAHVELASLQSQQGQPAHALETLLRCAQAQPRSLPLLARDLARLALQIPQHHAQVVALLTQANAQVPRIDVTLALIELQPQRRDECIAAHLQREHSLLIAVQALRDVPALPPYVMEAIEHAADALRRYRCAACGFETHAYFWQCPGCQTWDSFPALRAEEI